MSDLPAWSPVSQSKYEAEKAFLCYTPIWMCITGSIMVTGIAEKWGDYELMAFGVLLALGCLLFALWKVSGSSSSIRQKNKKTNNNNNNTKNYATRYVIGMFCSATALAFAANYIQTPFFFDVLHMRYGFNVTWRIERNPIFLYFVTIPYFLTYSSGGCFLYRFITNKIFSSNQIKEKKNRKTTTTTKSFLSTFISIVVVAVLLAFLETLTNANPFVRHLFCYEDSYFALTFGSLCYGIMFVFALPAWLWYSGIPEAEDDKNPESASIIAAHGIIVNIAVAVIDGIILYFVRHYVAPNFTNVQQGAGPFGECLKV